MVGPVPLTLLVTAFVASLAVGACEQSEHDADLVRALEATVTALEAEDWKTVWLYSAKSTQERLLDLHAKLHGALEVVDRTVAPEDLKAARAALGAELVSGLTPGGDGVGPRLLSRLLTAGDIRLDDHARDGLRVRNVVFDGDHATIETIAGETFTFDKTNTGWQSRLLSDILVETGVIETYLEHAAAVSERATAQAKAWRESTDPKTPHGAYNLARTALSAEPLDSKSLFAFLDDDARKVLILAIDRSRDVQRSLQKRKRGAERVIAYKKRKMWHHVRAGSDRQLYMYWAKLPEFEAPFATRAAPIRVETSEDGDLATVHTEDGHEITFKRADHGNWKLANQATRLRKLLWEPMDRAYERLARPPKFWKYKD
jgi:hypothetical protein